MTQYTYDMRQDKNFYMRWLRVRSRAIHSKAVSTAKILALRQLKTKQKFETNKLI